MKLIKPYFVIEHLRSGSDILKSIEKYGRTCYKSEDKITPSSAEKFCRMVVDRGHLSVVEHECATVRFICDRGVTHELVRHRLVSYSQESTRYCNYSGGVTFIIPPWTHWEDSEYTYEDMRDRVVSKPSPDLLWAWSMAQAEKHYLHLLQLDWSPQQARSVLPNSLKTEIVTTANLREWRHIFKLRTSKKAHPQMRELMVPLLIGFRGAVPVIFDGIGDVTW